MPILKNASAAPNGAFLNHSSPPQCSALFPLLCRATREIIFRRHGGLSITAGFSTGINLVARLVLLVFTMVASGARSQWNLIRCWAIHTADVSHTRWKQAVAWYVAVHHSDIDLQVPISSSAYARELVIRCSEVASWLCRCGFCCGVADEHQLLAIQQARRTFVRELSPSS